MESPLSTEARRAQGAPPRYRALIVEDHDAFALRMILASEGYDTAVAGDSTSGLAAVRSTWTDLVLLNLDLPGPGSYELLRALQSPTALGDAWGPPIPVLVMSCQSAEEEKVRAFRAGAGDYVTKPFGVRELLARAGALMRRTRGAYAPAYAPRVRYSFGAVEVDVAARAVTRGGRPTALPPLAFDLLLALLRRDGATASRDELRRELRGYSANLSSRRVDAYVVALRRAIEEDPARPRHVRTVHGVGYRLER